MSNVALLVLVFLKSGSFHPVELLRSHLFQFSLEDERVTRVEQKRPKTGRLNSEIQYALFTEGTVVFFSRLRQRTLM